MYGYETFHDELMQNLINSVHSGLSSHAYIFEGKEGLGVRNAARLFAAALTCRNREIAPCGECPSCKEAKADTNPDIVYVNSGDKKSIGAEKMRALEEDVAIKPFAAERKVYIIEDGALLTEAAQNVFLKTFEEPPEYAVFIIVIENSSLLLETVLSRFTLIHFPCVSDAKVESYIKSKYPDETERVPFLVKYCAGIPGEADKVIENAEFENLRQVSLEKFSALLSHDKKSAFIISKFAEENKDDFSKILDFWLSFSRDIILLQTDADERIINIDKKDELRGFSSQINPERTVKIFGKIVKTQKMLSRYVNIKATAMWLAL
ncbi:MAG: hypothetical protein J1F01_09180 [Oscillospiraceae bacterium]|nr:hypothetical protein [Oscillospiraceae bacterium]